MRRNASGNHLAFRERQRQPGATPLRRTNPIMRFLVEKITLRPGPNRGEIGDDRRPPGGNYRGRSPFSIIAMKPSIISSRDLSPVGRYQIRIQFMTPSTKSEA